MSDEGHQLSEYERQRLERIRKNQEYLESLGLRQHKDKLKEMTQKTKRNQQREIRLKAKPGEERRSKRFQKGETKLLMLDYSQLENMERAIQQDDYFPADDDDDDDENDDGSPRAVTTRRVSSRGLCLPNREDFVLTASEKATLAKNTMDSNYLQKFREFLVFHNKISDQNARNVMRQVTKLATGQGVRYESPQYGWLPHQYFRKGQPVTPLSDFVELMEEARECENRWGRDHGNGWLLSHPLKKMLLFQQFCLQNPDFLAAEGRLEDYYKYGDEEDDIAVTEEEATEEETEQVATPRKEKNCVGSRVAKDFDGTIYLGTVQSCDAASNFSKVVYDDGDEEDLSDNELDQALKLFQEAESKANQTESPQPPQRKRGGPRKDDQKEGEQQPPKRKRGRPRKETGDHTPQQPKRKRGRSRKEELPVNLVTP